MEDELHSSQQQYRQCLDELEQFERKIHDLEREIAQGKELNVKYCRDVSSRLLIIWLSFYNHFCPFFMSLQVLDLH